MRILSILFLVIFTAGAETVAQQPVGSWREHLPYGSTIDVAYGDGRVFCATPFSVFAYDTGDQSIQRVSKVNKLSGSDLSCVVYDEATSTLLVGYQSGNLDIISSGVPFNLPDIANSSVFGDKRIYEVFVDDGSAYLCCGFGVVVVNIANKEVRETWFLEGQNDLVKVNALTRDELHWFAATDRGLYRAEVTDPFLVSFEAWEHIETPPLEDAELSDVMLYNDRIFVINEQGDDDAIWYAESDLGAWTLFPFYMAEELREIDAGGDGYFVVCEKNGVRVYAFTGEGSNDGYEEIDFRGGLFDIVMDPAAAVIDDNNVVWFANDEGGMFRFLINGEWQGESRHMPDGPPAFNVRRIDAYNNNIWIASGGVDASWTNNYDKKGIYGLVNDRWVIMESPEGENDIGSVNDYMAVSVNPLNNDHIALGSWEEGLIEVRNGEVTEIYNEENSPLELVSFGGSPRIGIAGVDFDEDGNLWFTNAYSSNSLMMQSSSGSFYSWNLSPEINSEEFLGDVVAARQGYIWAIAPRGNGLLVLDPKETPTNPNDDEYRLLTAEEGNGGLPTNDIFSLEEDLDGEMWVGTLQGLAVFYSPEAIFNSDNFDAQQILIEQDGNIQILLETEQINCIEIDGANRKWIGTESNGVFLLSEDGLNQVVHFTDANSPLLSNTVFDIAINQENGEVFFGTSRGIVSYIGTATNFDPDISEVTVYPNPVREDYTGSVTIEGLAFESEVRITDASGNLVYTTLSNGGRATWNATGPDGKRVSTGVYLVFCSSPDGSASNVAKVAVIR